MRTPKGTARSFAALAGVVLAMLVWLHAPTIEAASRARASATPSRLTKRATVRPTARVLAETPVLATAGTWSGGAGVLSLAPAAPIAPLPAASMLAPPPPAPAGATSTDATSDDATPVAVAPAPSRSARDVRSTLKASRSVPPFWIDRTYDTHRTRAIGFPPLFLHRTPTKEHPEKLLHVDLALTFGWGNAEGKRRWLSPVGLFFGSFSERKTVWGAAPLLMGYRRIGEQYNFGQFPLVWAWGTKYVKNLLVAPFHYQQKRPDGFRGVSAILFWYGHKHREDTNAENDRGWFVAAPVFYRFRRGMKRFDFAFAYMGAENRLKGRKWVAVTPFALWHESEFGNRHELWTLPWLRRTDRARGRSAWAVPIALTFSHRDRDRRLFAATPLVWRTHNILRGSDFTLVGPVGVYSDPRQRNIFAAPLWFQFQDRANDTMVRVFAPLGFSRRTPDRTGVWTVLGGGMRTAKGYGAFVPPLLTWVGRRDDGTSMQGVLGMFWHVNRPGGDRPRRTVVLGPLGFFDAQRGGERERIRGGIPLAGIFAGRHGNTRWQVLTPLIWHAHDPEARRRTLVVAPFYHHRRGDDLDGGVAPLVFWGAGTKYRYGIAPALLFADVQNVREKSHLTLSPVFVRHSAPGQRTMGVAGLVWDVVRDGGAEHHTAVVPFFYRRDRDGKRLTVSWVGGVFKTPEARTTVWGPFVRRQTPNRTVTGVAPLVWTTTERNADGVTRNVSVVPFVIHHRSPKDDLDMFSPLVWRREIRGERARKNLAVVPFYFRQRQPGGVDVDGGVGFFWSRDRGRRTHTLIAGPFFHRLSRKSLNTGVVPLAWWMDTETDRRLVSLPTIVHIRNKKTGEHTTVAAPLWFDRRRSNGRRTWGAFPFVFGGKRLYNFTRFSIAPPGFVDVFRIQRNSRFTGFVPLLFRHRKCGYLADDDPKCAYTLWGSIPLFLYGKDGNGRRTHGSLLYVYDRDPGGMRLYTPLFGLHNRPGKVLSWYAGPISMRTTNTHRRVLAFPLYFRRQHRLEDRSLTLAVPPLFIARHREDRRFFEAGLVVWQVRQQHKVATAVLPPLFFHSHAFAQRRLTWVLPLFLRDDNWGEDQAWTAIGPLAYVQRRKGENLDFVQFPLVWHIERGENQFTFGAFAWWDIRRGIKQVQVVPGAYLRAAGSRLDTHVIGPGLGWWTRGRGATEGDFHWRALLGLFGAGVENGRRYVSIFGGRIDRGPGQAPPERKRVPRAKRAGKRGAKAKGEAAPTRRAAPAAAPAGK
jgi:hypothetical protein